MTSEAKSVFKPSLPRDSRPAVTWSNLAGCSRALALWEAARAAGRMLLVVTSGSQEAQQLQTELRFFAGDRADDILIFPDWETLPYDVFSPHQDIVSQRLATLYRLPDTHQGILIVPIATLAQRLPPRSYVEASSLMLAVGETLDLQDMRLRLERAGYRCVSEAMEHGEFAVRGSILDIYPMGSDRPYRIDLFDDEVESIRTFEPESQLSVDKVDRIRLLPAREFPTDADAIKRFRNAFRARFEGDPTRSVIYRDVSGGLFPNGIEYYLPLFFEQTSTMLEHIPADSIVVYFDDLEQAAGEIWNQILQRYEQRRHDIERPLLPPADIAVPPEELGAALKALSSVRIHEESEAEAGKGAAPGVVRFATRPPAAVRLHPQPRDNAVSLEDFLAADAGRTLIVAETAGRREALLESLNRHGIRPAGVDNWQGFLASDQPLGITIGQIEHGSTLLDPALTLLTEASLFGERAQQRRRRRSTAERDPSLIIRDLTDLRIGAPVVHEDNGVGRYLGLQTLHVGDFPQEFLTLEYAAGDKLYVPVSSLHLISRYTGSDDEHAPLHRLGGEQWEKAKRKAAEKVRDVAAELLDIYARRAAREGQAIDCDAEDYAAFAEAFPFEETPDQQEAIDAVLGDLGSPRPMDRVVCGDVGFGKTEVAMRAAFVAAQSGRQVAVLVPTTLLAQQHFQNFRDRFADWPVRIETLSRFVSTKDQKGILEGLGDGRVDIVIGTHKLLQSDVRFKNLGLVIIDEEHRFGVRQKDRLKALRAEVDVLTLTATPIPRTLNMSLAGMRDLSIIATPPARRLAVKTFVNQWNDALIQEAFLRELKRGGQVYFLHNDVESIGRMASSLEELVPQAKLGIAHGQMAERELERVMLDFYHQRFNVLLCTTIIESGIDIPSANTIVINRADRFGLAQLHQLRGRVGRSHHRAYAYLVAPPKKLMTADAAKRLEAISSLEDLGVGFALASHDLEIRGAGELLGDEQSGQIQEIGFSLYTELLDRAVKDLKAGREPAFDRPLHHGAEVDLRIPALLPEDYLPDVHARLVLYKRIANAENHQALRELQVEMIDRFGLLPDAAKNLFAITELKFKAERIGIMKIEAGPSGGAVEFGEGARIDPAKVVQLIQRQPSVFKLDGQTRLRFRTELDDRAERLRYVDGLLDELAEREAA